MKKVLITGITGQDGSYLAELLLEKGYEVHGVVRRSSVYNRSRIEHLISDAKIYNKKLFLHYCDIQDVTTMRRILNRYEPCEFYHLAGQSHAGLSFEIPESTSQEVAHATLAFLEILRDMDNPPRMYHAASSEIFGSVETYPQNVKTSRCPTSPYGAAKAYATNLCEIYRKAYGLFICNGIAYNHESPRRGENFVTMKICREVAKIKLGMTQKIKLGDLHAERDWGYAPDYVKAMWMMLQQDHADDYILATGKLHSVNDIVQIAFNAVDISMNHKIERDERYIRPAEPTLLLGDPTETFEKLGWTCTLSFKEMIEEMVHSQIDKLSRTNK